MAKVILDAGHGGAEPGAVYEGRREKDDTLRLALAVGEILRRNGVEVAYTRTEDVYDTPLEKARAANREGGDFLISFHRNSSPEPNQYSGVESLIFDPGGRKLELAENMNRELEKEGFQNLGVHERRNLAILRRSRMPAVLVEVGFLNSDEDNARLDRGFDGIAQAIADGIWQTLQEDEMEFPAQGGAEMMRIQSGRGADTMWVQEESGSEGGWMQGEAESDAVRTQEEPERLYRVQVGAFYSRARAEELLYQLQRQSFPAFVLFEAPLYKVQSGVFRQLDNAVRMEQALRRSGYATFIAT